VNLKSKYPVDKVFKEHTFKNCVKIEVFSQVSKLWGGPICVIEDFEELIEILPKRAEDLESFKARIFERILKSLSFNEYDVKIKVKYRILEKYLKTNNDLRNLAKEDRGTYVLKLHYHKKETNEAPEIEKELRRTGRQPFLW
jgi:hypothetical protein